MEHPESIPLETLRTQDGNIKELCQPIKTEKFSNLIANRQFSGQSSINVMNSTAREFLSSINASSAAISGLYCTGVEANVKDMTSPSCASSTVLSGMHSSEGIIKEYSAFSSLKNPGIPKSHVTGMTIPGSSHIQKPWNSQRPQNDEVKSLEREASSQPTVRIARPPSEGRGKNQLLPRYWPRVTDQELQLLTAKDSNCVVTPLFEKVLSMSDAGKIGRLVLPKACAEEFFPPISQAEGLPIVIQDVSGKDWHFQFRFWPNNNSRMYVLEGITPYIQCMQLQAGDTVIFSRRDPERKLVMGYRRASNNSTAEDAKTTNSGSTSISPIMQTFPRKMDRTSTVANAACLDPPQAKSYSRAQVMVHKNFANVSSPHAQGHSHVFPKPGNIGSQGTREASTYNLTVFSDKRKAKDIASKAKRPKYDLDSLEFKMNWEEAQSLLRSPPNVIPNIVTIEGYDFEEYEDPPVFGNGAVFTGGLQGKISNIHQSRLKDATEVLLQHATDMASNDASSAKRQKPIEPPKECEAFSGLETLAYLATVEGDMSAAPTSPATITGKTSPVISCVPSTTEAVAASSRMVSVASSSSSPATTTKHPRHRPGCTCIVCIQPPSGKGPKHKPNCDCNVCVTVKRRFHTLMLRRKKLQSEKEAESSSQKNQPMLKESMEGIRAKRPNDLSSSAHKNGSWQGGVVPSFIKSMPQITDAILSKNGEALKLASTSPYIPVVVKMESNLQIGSKGPQIDLNSQPEEDSKSTPGLSMKSLLQNASYPLDIYLKQHGLTSLVCNDKLQGALESGSGFPCVKKDSTPEERDSVVAVYSCEQHGHSEPLPESHVKL